MRMKALKAVAAGCALMLAACAGEAAGQFIPVSEFPPCRPAEGGGLICRTDSSVSLHYAALNDAPAAVEHLLESGADVDAESKWGQTPLHFAALNGALDVAELLLAHGADVNAEDEEGLTPLHYASMNDVATVAKLLLENGADVNAENEGGFAPSDFAISAEMESLLQAHGAE